MTIGSGIAIAAIWATPLAAVLSKDINGMGCILCLTFAVLATGMVATVGH